MSSLTNLSGVSTYGQTPSEPSFRYKRRNMIPPVRYRTGHRELLCELHSALKGGPAKGQALSVALERRMLGEGGGGAATIIVWDLWWAGDVALDQVCVPLSPKPIIIPPLQNTYLNHYFNRRLSAVPFCRFA